MRRKTIKSIVSAMSLAVVMVVSCIYCNNTEVYETVTVQKITDISKPVDVQDITDISKPIAAIEVMELVEEEEVLEVLDISEPQVSTEDIELLALVTMAEAEGECELGKRLVIDTILNRVDSDNFPDTISEVIFQKSQFSSMWNGRIDRCYVMDDIYTLVEEELKERTNFDVVYFHADKYGKYGEPLFQVENHYFSKE